MSKTTKIEKFIVENDIDLSGTGSNLNGACVVLAGYACYLDLDWEDLKEQIGEGLSDDAETELLRVFDYAQEHNYGNFWETEEAKEQYVF